MLRELQEACRSVSYHRPLDREVRSLFILITLSRAEWREEGDLDLCWWDAWRGGGELCVNYVQAARNWIMFAVVVVPLCYALSF